MKTRSKGLSCIVYKDTAFASDMMTQKYLRKCFKHARIMFPQTVSACTLSFVGCTKRGIGALMNFSPGDRFSQAQQHSPWSALQSLLLQRYYLAIRRHYYFRPWSFYGNNLNYDDNINRRQQSSWRAYTGNSHSRTQPSLCFILFCFVLCVLLRELKKINFLHSV